MAVLQEDYITEEQAREQGLLKGPMPTEEELQENTMRWMTNNTRHSMREARMLRKFWVRSPHPVLGL